MEKGTVIKSTGRWYLVKNSNNEVIECGIKGKFRTDDLRTTNPVAVGDNVWYDIIDNQKGLIRKIENKKNYIIRKSTNLSKAYHIIASNIDQSILMIGIAYPETPLEFADRFLVTAEAYKIPVIIVFNKIDLFNDSQKETLKKTAKIYRDIGYKCVKSSAVMGTNISAIKEVLNAKRSVIIGQSGTGKSSLLNYIDKKIEIKTKEISNYHNQGKHTTTFAEMHELSFGGEIIDTPGIKGFGIVDIDKNEIAHYFPEIFEISNNCKFNNCTHTNEPGCAVIEAVKNEKIYRQRYLSYLSIYNDAGERYRQ